MNKDKSLPLGVGNFELYICRAIKKECYIEVISLIHNTIELYLSSNVIIYFSNRKKNSLEYYLKRESILSGKGNISKLIVWAEINFLFNLIDEDTFNQIKKFNSSRNIIVHKLLKSKKNSKKNYRKIKEIAKLGREIQLKLSPLNHSRTDIKRILYFFDNPNEAKNSYYDWDGQ